MIQLAEGIEGYDARKVLIPPTWKKVLIEFVSNRLIDMAIVDSATMQRFDQSSTGEDVEIEWLFESTRQSELEWERSVGATQFYVLFWNANDDKTAYIAYKITPLTVP